MSRQPPVDMSGALPASKTPTTAQHLNPSGAQASSSNIPSTDQNFKVPGPSSTHHSSHSTAKPSKPSPPDAGPSRPSPPNPTHSNPDDPTEPPKRIASFRPDISPAEPTLLASEADEICSGICARFWNTNLGHMFDKVVATDRRGQIDDRLYSQLLDFFYCFVPMVVVAPRSDPVIVRAGDLGTHRKIMNMFGPGRDLVRERGPHKPHRWFSRPKSAGLLSFLFDALGSGQIM